MPMCRHASWFIRVVFQRMRSAPPNLPTGRGLTKVLRGESSLHLGLLLRDAVDVASAEDDLLGVDADDLAVRVGGLDVLERLCVVGIAELRHEHGAVAVTRTRGYRSKKSKKNLI